MTEMSQDKAEKYLRTMGVSGINSCSLNTNKLGLTSTDIKHTAQQLLLTKN